jgi:hypothetical protein
MKLKVLLAAALVPALAACGTPKDLPEARRTIASSERDLVAELRHADADRAAQVRGVLGTTASAQSREAVEAGEVAQGMAAVDALRAWGDPDRSFRPWLLTTGRDECWVYEAHGLPDIQLWLGDGRVRSVWYAVTGSQPDVPRGKFGWRKQWLSLEGYRGSEW